MKDKSARNATPKKHPRFGVFLYFFSLSWQICQSIHQYKVYKDTLFNWQIQFLFRAHYICECHPVEQLQLLPISSATDVANSYALFLCFAFFTLFFFHSYTYISCVFRFRFLRLLFPFDSNVFQIFFKCTVPAERMRHCARIAAPITIVLSPRMVFVI